MVEDNDSGSTGAAGDTPSAPRRPRPRTRRPLWRQGRFWVAVIALEVVIALTLSFVLERSSTEVDLAGGDLSAFCAQANALRAQAEAAEPGSTDDPTRFEQEAAGYRSLVATAPDDLVVDLELLAELDDQLAATARRIAERKAEDPSYSGLVDLSDALEETGARGRVAAARVDVVLREQCGITRQPAGTTDDTTEGTVPSPSEQPAVDGGTGEPTTAVPGPGAPVPEPPTTATGTAATGSG